MSGRECCLLSSAYERMGLICRGYFVRSYSFV